MTWWPRSKKILQQQERTQKAFQNVPQSRIMNDIESRLARLEKTNRHYRAGLTASLGLLAIVATAGFGQVGQNQQQAFPRNIVADTITVTNLSAFTGTINQLGSNNATVQFLTLADGKADSMTIKAASVANLQAQRAAMGKTSVSQLDVTNGTSGAGILLAATTDGGSMQILDSLSRPVAALSSQGKGGLMSLYGKSGFVGAEIGADDNAGRFKIFDSANRMLASIDRNNSHDGEICTYSRGGNRVVLLNTDDTGRAGRIIVQREGALPMVKLESDEKGGLVRILDGKIETGRFPEK